MSNNNLPMDYEHVFRHAWVWSLLRSSAATAVFVIALVTTVVIWSAWPLLIAGVAAPCVIGHVLCHKMEAVVIRFGSVCITRGAFRVSTADIPLWQLRFETIQSPIERWCNYGTLYVYAEDTCYQIKGVAQLDLLRTTLIQQQYAVAMNRPLTLVGNAKPRLIRLRNHSDTW